MLKLRILVLLFLLGSNLFHLQSQELDSTKTLRLTATGELGYLAVLDHKIQFSNNGTYIDYVKEGGQDVLFPFSRLSLDLQINNKHTITFLYQPLRIESTALLDRDLLIDSLTFPKGTSVNFLYNFPFYRISYMKELLPKNKKFDFSLGASLQIRNAIISFESTDGSLFRSNRDIGPVPILKFKTRYTYHKRAFTEIEADGFYAPISYINGSDNEVTGAILDASLRQGLKITDEVQAFLNVRYLGGGAVGSSDNEPGPGDGYVKNWLHFGTVSCGFVYRFPSMSSHW